MAHLKYLGTTVPTDEDRFHTKRQTGKYSALSAVTFIETSDDYHGGKKAKCKQYFYSNSVLITANVFLFHQRNVTQ